MSQRWLLTMWEQWFVPMRSMQHKWYVKNSGDTIYTYVLPGSCKSCVVAQSVRPHCQWGTAKFMQGQNLTDPVWFVQITCEFGQLRFTHTWLVGWYETNTRDTEKVPFVRKYRIRKWFLKRLKYLSIKLWNGWNLHSAHITRQKSASNFPLRKLAWTLECQESVWHPEAASPEEAWWQKTGKTQGRESIHLKKEKKKKWREEGSIQHRASRKTRVKNKGAPTLA